MTKPTQLVTLPSGVCLDLEDIQYGKPDSGKSPYIVVFHNSERLYLGEGDRDALLALLKKGDR